MAFWNRKRSSDSDSNNENTRHGTNHVIIDQSNANILIDSARNLNVGQIAGTINNGVKFSEDSDTSEQRGSGNSISIGVVTWDSDDSDVFDNIDWSDF